METRCLWCNSGLLVSIMVLARHGLPHDAVEGHDQVYRYVEFWRCQECWHGQVEYLDHDCSDPDMEQDTSVCYTLESPGVSSLIDALKTCPQPMSSACKCSIHEGLRSMWDVTTGVHVLPGRTWRAVSAGASTGRPDIYNVSFRLISGAPLLLYVPRCSEAELVLALDDLGLHAPLVQAAMVLAREVHGGQVRDDGTLYLEEHIYPIAKAVAVYAKESPVAAQKMSSAGMAVATALLHDVLEDSGTLTRDDLAKQVLPEVAEAVYFLTKPSGPDVRQMSRVERERLYFINLQLAPDWVKTIKLFDRLNNLECIHKSSHEKRQRYLQETALFHLPMAEGIDQSIALRMKALVAWLKTYNNN